MKNILIMICLIFIGLPMQAQKNKNAKYTIDVNGNCEMCKKRIEKAAYSVAGVKSANWDIETQKLDLIVNEEKTNILEIKKAIANVGHDTDEVKTTPEIYEKLHTCCQYERKP